MKLTHGNLVQYLHFPSSRWLMWQWDVQALARCRLYIARTITCCTLAEKTLVLSEPMPTASMSLSVRTEQLSPTIQ